VVGAQHALVAQRLVEVESDVLALSIANAGDDALGYASLFASMPVFKLGAAEPEVVEAMVAPASVDVLDVLNADPVADVAPAAPAAPAAPDVPDAETIAAPARTPVGAEEILN
jgi:hypothetical protein